MKKIYLIRHAENFLNTGKIVFKEEAIRLTELGKTQAEQLANSLAKPDLIIVSKYMRAIATAEPLFLKYQDVPIEIWRDIHEFNYLSFSKENRGDLLFKQKEEKYWELLDPNYRDGEDVETFSEFATRVYNTFDLINKIKIQGNIYIFTHRDFMRLFVVFQKFYKKSKDRKFLISEIKNAMKEYKDTYASLHINNCEMIEVFN